MKTEQTVPNGFSHINAERSLGDEFHESVLPQITGLLSDVEAVLRSEARLVEARFNQKIEKTQHKLLSTVIGVWSLIFALGLFVVTIVYEMAEYFPNIPIWAVTGTLSVVACIAGGFLLTGPSRSKNLEGE